MDRDESARTEEEEGAAEKAFAAERAVSFVRFGVVGVNSIVYAFLMDPSGTLPWLAYLIIVIANAYAFGVVAFEPYRRFKVLLSSYFTSVTDAALITAWIFATGGADSPFIVLWMISLTAVAFRYGSTRRWSRRASTQRVTSHSSSSFATFAPTP